MGLDIDKLSLKVEASSDNAEKKLDKLIVRLETLKKSVGKLSGLDKLSEKLNKIAASANAISGVDKLAKLVESVSKLSQIKSPNVTKTVNSIKKLSEACNAVSGMSNVSVLKENITAITEACKPMQEMGKNNLSPFLNSLKKIPDITKSLDTEKINEFATRIRQLTTAIEPLTTQVSKAENGLVALNGIMKSSIARNGNLASANAVTVKSYTSLSSVFKDARIRAAALYVTVNRAADALADCLQSSNEYVENINLFTVAMGDYSEEAYRYAEKVNSLLGIDISEWIRFQGVFKQITTGFGVAAEKSNIMSKNLTQIGYDIASFFNISIEDAMQKVESGISGELEPLRRLGYALDAATLQQIAYDNGIQQNINTMTQAQKSQLRYVAILQQSTNVMGDMARTIVTPANSMRILQQQFEQLKRAIGNIVSVFAVKMIPYVQVFVRLLTDAANAIAKWLGFELPTIDYSEVGKGLSSVTENADNATESVKETKKALLALASFDEINQLNLDKNNGNDSGDTTGNKYDLGIDLPEYDFLAGLDKQTDALYKKVKAQLKELYNWLKKHKDMIKVIAGLLATVWAVNKLANLINWVKKLKGAFGGLSVIKTCKTWLKNFTDGFKNSEATSFFGKMNDGVKNFRSNISPVARVLGTVVGMVGAGIGSYNLFNKLSSDTLTWKSALGDTALIVGGLGVSWLFGGGTGLAIGIITTAIAGMVGALKGVDDEIIAADKAYSDSLLFNNGGMKIDEFTDYLNAQFSSVQKLNKELSDYDSKISDAHDSVEQSLSVLNNFQQSLKDTQTVSADEIKKIKDSLNSLVENMKSEFSFNTDKIFAAFRNQSSKTAETLGIDVGSMTTILQNFQKDFENSTDDLNNRAQELLDKMSTGNATEKDIKDLQDVMSTIQELSVTASEEQVKFNDAVKGFANIDFEDLDTFKEKAEELKTTYKNLSKNIEDNHTSVKTSLETFKLKVNAMFNNGLIDESKYKENMQLYSNMIKLIDSDYEKQKTNLKNTMSGIVNGIYNEFENAIAEGTTNATATAKEAMEATLKTGFGGEEEYQKNLTDIVGKRVRSAYKPISGEISNLFDSLDIDIDRNYGAKFMYQMTKNGENGSLGLAEGIKSKSKSVTEVASQIGLAAVKASATALDEHSPSRKTFQQGVFFLQGFMNGIKLLSTFMNTYVAKTAKSAVTTFDTNSATTSIGIKFIDRFKNGIDLRKNSLINDIVDIFNTILDKADSFHVQFFNSFNSAVPAIQIASNGILAAMGQAVSIPQISYTAPGYRVQGYANGGYPATGQLFVARENGTPEMVGSIGSRNAVANNDQITAAISQAVYQAVREANRDTQNSGSRNNEMTVKIVPDKNSFVKVAVDGINDTTRRTGKSPLH